HCVLQQNSNLCAVQSRGCTDDGDWSKVGYEHCQDVLESKRNCLEQRNPSVQLIDVAGGYICFFCHKSFSFVVFSELLVIILPISTFGNSVANNLKILWNLSMNSCPFQDEERCIFKTKTGYPIRTACFAFGYSLLERWETITPVHTTRVNPR